MSTDKNYQSGNTTMLILKLLECNDMYGYQIIEELAKRSDNTFCLKTGTLYPLLHGLENDGCVTSYDQNADNQRIRKYYSITPKGKKLLKSKNLEWTTYKKGVNLVMEGFTYATV